MLGTENIYLMKEEKLGLKCMESEVSLLNGDKIYCQVMLKIKQNEVCGSKMFFFNIFSTKQKGPENVT